jgi:DNA-binding NarL/FixJ family response regulator
MTPSARVHGTPASYRRGLEAALTDERFVIAAPDEPAALVLAPLTTPSDCGSFDDLTDAPDTVVVALLSPADPDDYAHAFAHGADGAAPFDAEPARIAAIARAAFEGDAVVPAEALTALARRGGDPHRHVPPLDPIEVEWILALAKGATVVEIADRYGYSERAMFRKLGDIYARLGAAGRAEALVAAGRLGLLDDDPPGPSSRQR